MKRFGLVHLKYLYRMVGKAIDLYAEMKEEFEAYREKVKAETEPVEVIAEEVDG